AFAAVAPEFTTVSLEIIGEGPERENLIRLANQLGVTPRVRFLGRKSRKEVADAMRRCSVFALPSRYEGLGCVYLEAMACGKPVVACRGQGIEEIVEHEKNGLLTSPGSVTELAEALQSLLQSESLRARLGSAAQKTIVQRCTLEHQAAELSRIYRECLA
ncbi:MAG TPA: glycosyltransferase family 4 protein, partial [Terriglobales bacterium]